MIESSPSWVSLQFTCETDFPTSFSPGDGDGEASGDVKRGFGETGGGVESLNCELRLSVVGFGGTGGAKQRRKSFSPMKKLDERTCLRIRQ